MVEDRFIREGVFNMQNRDAAYYIEHLNMEQHPEGGHFARSYYSDEKMNTSENKIRNLYTTIYFCLNCEEVSHLHRLQSDELWFFHDGSSLTVHVILPNGEYKAHQLGLNFEKGETPQVLVPKGAIFGSSVDQDESFSLVGCMVSPGFDFEDFELFTQEELLTLYPQHKEIIEKMAFQKIVGQTHL